MANKEFDELFTNDESSSEAIKSKGNIKKRKMERQIGSSLLNTPAKSALKQMNTVTRFQEVTDIHKSNVLFSPCPQLSVRQRIKAFEQASNISKLTMNIDALRITSTKTRAEARAEKEASENANMAKEAKISLLKQTMYINDKDS